MSLEVRQLGQPHTFKWNGIERYLTNKTECPIDSVNLTVQSSTPDTI